MKYKRRQGISIAFIKRKRKSGLRFISSERSNFKFLCVFFQASQQNII